jgi:hypothetical protein
MVELTMTCSTSFNLIAFDELFSNSGHMIKFQLFDTERSYQCHFAEISTFVVSVAHFMRAYFNYQALSQGKNFRLPDDAAYLNVSTVHQTFYPQLIACIL